MAGFAPHCVRILYVCILLSILLVAVSRYDKLRATATNALHASKKHAKHIHHQHLQKPDVQILVTGTDAEDADWLEEAVPTWSHKLYLLNGTVASRGVHRSKDTATRAYLTHIIDNYHHLAPVTVFHGAQRYQMLANNRVFDSEAVLRQLRTQRVKNRGYANLRCDQEPGCPKAMVTTPDDSWSGNKADDIAPHFKEAFELMLPGEPLPDKVSIPAGTEFAVADWAIRQRSLIDYKRIRQWLDQSDLEPEIRDAIVDRTWHILFGMEAYSCPDFKECQCGTFGLCSMDCGPGGCDDQVPVQASLRVSADSNAVSNKMGKEHASPAWLQTEPLRKPSHMSGKHHGWSA